MKTTGTPAVTEKDFQRQVTDLAELLGWSWAHFRPAQTARGWRTPVSGPLGAGWPDLVLVRPRDGRIVFAELKQDKARTSSQQDSVLDVLRSVAAVHVWRPRDFDRITEVLR